VSRKKKKQIRAPVILQTLSKPPDGSWPQGAFYHGTRIGLLVLLAAAITLLFPSDTGRTVDLYQEGDVGREDLAAEGGFDIPKDPVELERQQAEAAAAVPPVFLYEANTQDRIETRLNGFFDRIQEAVEAGGRPAVEDVLEEEALPSLVEKAENFLSPIELQALRQASLSVVRQLVDRVLDSDHEGAVLSAGRIHVWADGVERHLDVGELLWGTDFYNAAVQALGPSTSEFQDIVRLLLIHFFESPYTLDVRRTAARLSEVRSAVPTTEGSVVAGAYIVRRGDQIGPSELRRLTAHQTALQSQGLIRELERDWSSLLGKFLLNLLLLGIFGLLLFFFRKEIYGNYRWVLLLAFLVFVYFLAAAGFSWQWNDRWELLPIAFVVLPVAILWDGRMALILALVLGVLSGAQEPFDSYPILAFTLIGGATAAFRPGRSGGVLRHGSSSPSSPWVMPWRFRPSASWGMLSPGTSPSPYCSRA